MKLEFAVFGFTQMILNKQDTWCSIMISRCGTRVQS